MPFKPDKDEEYNLKSRIPQDEMRWKGIILRYAYSDFKKTFNREGSKVQDFTLDALVLYLDKLREDSSDIDKANFSRSRKCLVAMYMPEYQEHYKESNQATRDEESSDDNNNDDDCVERDDDMVPRVRESDLGVSTSTDGVQTSQQEFARDKVPMVIYNKVTGKRKAEQAYLFVGR
jgi:hypothetical protein